MPEYLVKMYLDGFENPEEELKACKELIEERLSDVSAEVTESYYDAEV